MATVSFTEMKHGTQEDYAILQEFEHKFNAKTAHRLFEQLERQGHESIEGYAISRLEHGLQSATRAWREGANDDWVVAALLHDIGDGLAPQNHDRMAAEIIPGISLVRILMARLDTISLVRVYYFLMMDIL